VPSGVAQITRFEAGIALLDRLQLLDDVLRPAGEEAASFHRILDRRQLHGPGKPRVAHSRDLLAHALATRRVTPSIL
jgi:hypothetical protein